MTSTGICIDMYGLWTDRCSAYLFDSSAEPDHGFLRRAQGCGTSTESVGSRRQSSSISDDSAPSVPEQRRIADILDQADALRAKRRAASPNLTASRSRSSSICSAIPRRIPRVGPSYDHRSRRHSASDGTYRNKLGRDVLRVTSRSASHRYVDSDQHAGFVRRTTRRISLQYKRCSCCVKVTILVSDRWERRSTAIGYPDVRRPMSHMTSARSAH